MKQKGVALDAIVDHVARRGISFEFTPALVRQLAKMGFDADQIEVFKQAAHGPRKKEAEGPPAVAGQNLPSADALRDRVQEHVKTIAINSGLNLRSSNTPHITLWTAKEVPAAEVADYLASVKKIEAYYEDKCNEPLRSGLDKRASHIVLLKTRYDYQRWVKALFAEIPEMFAIPETPGGEDELKAAALTWNVYYSRHFVVLCMGNFEKDAIRRTVASGVGYMNFAQQVAPLRHDPLSTGFADRAESLLYGDATVVIFSPSYHNVERDLGKERQSWLSLVKQRMRTKKATGVAELLKTDASQMQPPQYAEAWTLVGLLMKQPDKFGKLLLELRKEQDALKAIEKVYDWNEEQLEAAWHKDAMGQGAR
jgi:hypothetical protein